MIEKSTVKIADWLIRCQVITEEDRELYEYAIYSIFLTISPLFLRYMNNTQLKRLICKVG